MRSVVFAFPGNLDSHTGGYGYDRNVIRGLRELGWVIDILPLGNGFPHVEPAELDAAERHLDGLPNDTMVVIDGLAFGVMERWASRNQHRLKIVALVHHPLAMETGLDKATRDRFAESEAVALRFATGVLVTSQTTGSNLTRSYDVSLSKICVAVPGVDPAHPSTGLGDPPLILSVGTLTRRKGHDVLIAALEQLRDLHWRCRIVGSPQLDPIAAAEIHQQLDRSSIRERVQLVGEVKDVRAEFSKADIFALATRYEGYGMVFAEALAHHLPIIGCNVGAVPGVVSPEAGLLVPANDPDTFASALRRIVESRGLRITMAKSARHAALKLPSWTETSSTISRFLQELS